MLCVITGPPGSGKTTVASALTSCWDQTVLLHADDFWHVIQNGVIAPWREEANEQNQTVIRAIGACAATFIGGGYNVIVDGIIGPWFLEIFHSALGKTQLQYVVLRPSREVALARATSRSSGLVDTQPVVHMYDQFTDLGIYEQHVIDTSDQTPEDTARELETALLSGRYELTTTP